MIHKELNTEGLPSKQVVDFTGIAVCEIVKQALDAKIPLPKFLTYCVHIAKLNPDADVISICSNVLFNIGECPEHAKK